MAIRVLVVDDSVFFRTKLQISLSADKDIQVVSCASNSEEALQRILELSPDVVTLDVEMPKMSGIDFLKELIPKYPIPVVVVTSLPINALDALRFGAVDFVKKPGTDPQSTDHFTEKLKTTIKVASRARVKAPIVQSTTSLASRLSSTVAISQTDAIIAIGASTGGTEAIISVVKDIPETTPGIVIVQHMPENFTTMYAERLNRICKMSAKEAADRDRVVTGQIIVAAGSYHLTLNKDASGYYINSKMGERVSGHCPSVDVLFDSVAEKAGKNAIGIILTGMGADGARGLTKMRQNGAYTIGQDKDSCVVYGMPMEAYKMGGVVRQLPLDSISDEILYRLQTMSKNKA